jgi:hypothetical protein
MLMLNTIKKKADDVFLVSQRALPVTPGNSHANEFKTPMCETYLRAWLSCRGVDDSKVSEKLRNLESGEDCFILFER